MLRDIKEGLDHVGDPRLKGRGLRAPQLLPVRLDGVRKEVLHRAMARADPELGRAELLDLKRMVPAAGLVLVAAEVDVGAAEVDVVREGEFEVERAEGVELDLSWSVGELRPSWVVDGDLDGALRDVLGDKRVALGLQPPHVALHGNLLVGLVHASVVKDVPHGLIERRRVRARPGERHVTALVHGEHGVGQPPLGPEANLEQTSAIRVSHGLVVEEDLRVIDGCACA
mmetsp:Transcript_9475/g.18474  ORF Transcript_9475/g.18474 Transcript_9475/m.18474 type:complete len:228 (-) Transcript_9475:2026-2709(-)